VTLYRDGKEAEGLSSPLLKFPTMAGEIITVVLKGIKPSQKNIL
jgi:hypothetical protein